MACERLRVGLPRTLFGPRVEHLVGAFVGHGGEVVFEELREAAEPRVAEATANATTGLDAARDFVGDVRLKR